jgi:hypothetical protein
MKTSSGIRDLAAVDATRHCVCWRRQLESVGMMVLSLAPGAGVDGSDLREGLLDGTDGGTKQNS